VAAIKQATVKDTDPLDELEGELTGDNGDNLEELLETMDSLDESEVLADPEVINAADSDLEVAVGNPYEDYIVDDINEKIDKLRVATKYAAMREVKKFKPFIAAIKDPKARRMVSDSVCKLIRSSHGMTATKDGKKTGGRAS